LDEQLVREALDELVARKQSGDELAKEPPVELLSSFLETELQRLESLDRPEHAFGCEEDLNQFFRRYAIAS